MKIKPFSWIIITLTRILGLMKMEGLTSISWWWVFAPIWIPFSFFLMIILGLLVISAALNKSVDNELD